MYLSFGWPETSRIRPSREFAKKAAAPSNFPSENSSQSAVVPRTLSEAVPLETAIEREAPDPISLSAMQAVHIVNERVNEMVMLERWKTAALKLHAILLADRGKLPLCVPEGLELNPEWVGLGPDSEAFFAYHPDAFKPLP
jgi:hypothetical protein